MKALKKSTKEIAEDLQGKDSNMCCSPHVATVVAGILSILQSIGGLSWNVPVLLNITWNKTDVMSIASINIQEADNIIGVYGTALILAVLNTELLVYSMLLLKSNSELKIEWMRGWCTLILARSSAEFLMGFYYFNKYSGPIDISTETYYRMGVLSSGIFFFWPITNLILAAMVFKRSLDLALYNEGLMRAGRIAEQLGLVPPPYAENLSVQNQESDPAPVSGWADLRLIESPFNHDPFF